MCTERMRAFNRHIDKETTTLKAAVFTLLEYVIRFFRSSNCVYYLYLPIHIRFEMDMRDRRR